MGKSEGLDSIQAFLFPFQRKIPGVSFRFLPSFFFGSFPITFGKGERNVDRGNPCDPSAGETPLRRSTRALLSFFLHADFRRDPLRCREESKGRASSIERCGRRWKRHRNEPSVPPRRNVEDRLMTSIEAWSWTRFDLETERFDRHVPLSR